MLTLTVQKEEAATASHGVGVVDYHRDLQQMLLVGAELQLRIADDAGLLCVCNSLPVRRREKTAGYACEEKRHVLRSA